VLLESAVERELDMKSVDPVAAVPRLLAQRSLLFCKKAAIPDFFVLALDAAKWFSLPLYCC
jgi:hypothetical protein